MAREVVKVRGLTELNAALRKLPGEIEEDMGPPAQRAADATAGRVRSTVPRRSGALAGSVSTSQLSDGAEVTLGDGLAYGGWIEYGGSRGRPYVSEGRYVLPAAQALDEAFADDASRAAQNTIERFPWPRPMP